MNDKLNFDTIDILFAAIGGFVALSILPFPADRLIERIVVPLSMLLMVTIKRFLFPTKLPNPDARGILRMTYLLIAFVGTAFLGLALLAVYLDLAEFREPRARNALLLIGALLLSVATLIDKRFLKLQR